MNFFKTQGGKFLILKDYKVIPKATSTRLYPNNTEVIEEELDEGDAHFETALSENGKVIEEEPGEGENIYSQINEDFCKEDSNANFTWDHKATFFFLDEYEKRIDSFRNPKVKKKALWNSIANEMTKKGYQIDAAGLDRKMRNMKCTFKKISDNNKKRKTGRSRVNWDYYNRLCAIFAEDKTVNTDNLISSLPEALECDISKITSNSKVEIQNVPSDSSNSSYRDTPSNSREKQSRLDTFRKRQLAIEEQRLVEIKKIRIAVEESNRISQEKLNVFKKYLSNVSATQEKRINEINF